MIIDYKGKSPVIGKDVFIAPTAVIIGDVTIGDRASIWYGAVIRGDMEPIRIGRETNIQDNCVVHTDWGQPVVIGDKVTVGHRAVVHGSTVENNCLIGIAASVLNGARVRSGSVVAAGSVVREGQSVGPNHLMTGVPAELKKDLGEGMPQVLDEPADIYVDLAREHLALFPGDG